MLAWMPAGLAAYDKIPWCSLLTGAHQISGADRRLYDRPSRCFRNRRQNPHFGEHHYCLLLIYLGFGGRCALGHGCTRLSELSFDGRTMDGRCLRRSRQKLRLLEVRLLDGCSSTWIRRYLTSSSSGQNSQMLARLTGWTRLEFAIQELVELGSADAPGLGHYLDLLSPSIRLEPCLEIFHRCSSSSSALKRAIRDLPSPSIGLTFIGLEKFPVRHLEKFPDVLVLTQEHPRQHSGDVRSGGRAWRLGALLAFVPPFAFHLPSLLPSFSRLFSIGSPNRRHEGKGFGGIFPSLHWHVWRDTRWPLQSRCCPGALE